MKNYLRKKIRNLFSSEFSGIIKTLSNIDHRTQDALAYQKLLNDLKLLGFFPVTNWSIPPRLVLHVLNDIVLNDKKNIIEFGSGFSTICIANFIKTEKREIQFYSIESDENWFNMMRNYLKKMELEPFVEIILAPLDNQRELDNVLWYNLDVLNETLRNSGLFDLVIVDGPVGALSRNSRLPAIPYLQKKVSRNIKVFLDDTNRPDEKYIISEWARLLDGRIQSFNRYSVVSREADYGVVPYGQFSE